jgi:dinuclear metal center YbgI/SA1388 family protein
MKVAEVVKALERIAPPGLAEDWDNVGLLVGDADAEVRKLLLCIDLTAAVIDEARRLRAEMVMAYHPVIFSPISRLTAQQTPVAYRSASAGLAVYSVHTAFDAAVGGTNDALADCLNLKDRRPLQPARCAGQCKIIVFVPPDDLSRVSESAFAAGAGHIGNYRDCAFFCHGIGAFLGGPGSRPTVGRAGRHEAAEELRLEIIAPISRAAEVCRAIRDSHSYETPAIDVYPLEDFPAGCGMGRIGRCQRTMSLEAIVASIKRGLGVSKVSIAVPPRRKKGGGKIVTVACFAGAGRSGCHDAIAAGADLFLTGELPHHDALAATAAGMHVVCVGHSNSERIALASLARQLAK